MDVPTTPAPAERLAALARAAADGADAGAPAEVLADRADGTVVAVGGVVAKAHAPATEDEGAADLSVRLAVAAHPRLRGVLLPPLGAEESPSHVSYVARPLVPDDHGGRRATLWPRGAPVDPDDPGAVPWETAGALLARLHRVPPDALAGRLPGPLPPVRGPEKAARAMARMRAARAERHGRSGRSGGPAPMRPGFVDPHLVEAEPAGPDLVEADLVEADLVEADLVEADLVEADLVEAADAAEAAWATLPGWCRGEEPAVLAAAGTVCHGDFHLGQLVRRPSADGGAWLLIDVDDLGLGTPAWDLARPAAWYATGLLSAADWDRFLGAYQVGTGTSGLDPWPVLDAPARALTVQTAALAVAKAHAARRPLNAAETACVQACRRIGAPSPGQPGESGRRVETQETDR